MDKRSIHDIRIRLTVPDIYEGFLAAADMNTNAPFPFTKDDYSGDIALPWRNIDNATVQVRIHRSDTVSVIIACSQEPFPLDYSGIIAFFTTLGRVDGLLSTVMLLIYKDDINNHVIPSLSDWIITMWHFGRDSIIECSGEDFHYTIEKAGYVIERFYTKDLNGKTVLRDELVELPNKNPFKAINGKLLAG